MKKATLFTGLVRNEPLFLNFLNAYADLPVDQRSPLFFSTWFGELDRYPEVRAALRRVGAQVIEQHEPNLILPGHALHQMATIDLGLTVIGPDVFVYKSRPDFANIEAYKKFIAIEPMPPKKNGLAYPGQQLKFYVLALFPSQPFYINDITFAGLSNDLKQLADWSFVASVRYRRVAPEQCIWGGAAVPRVGAYDAFFRANVGLIFGNPDLFESNRKILLESPLYAQVLALFYELIENAFGNLDTHMPSFIEHAPSMTLEQFLWDPTDLACMGHHAQAHVNTISSMDFAVAVRNGLFQPSPLLDAVSAARSDLGKAAATSAADYAQALSLARDIGEATALIGIGGHKLPLGEAQALQVHAMAPDWRQAGERTSRVAELEAEVNMLRRTIDGLSISRQTKAGAE